MRYYCILPLSKSFALSSSSSSSPLCMHYPTESLRSLKLATILVYKQIKVCLKIQNQPKRWNSKWTVAPNELWLDWLDSLLPALGTNSDDSYILFYWSSHQPNALSPFFFLLCSEMETRRHMASYVEDFSEQLVFVLNQFCSMVHIGIYNNVAFNRDKAQ